MKKKNGLKRKREKTNGRGKRSDSANRTPTDRESRLSAPATNSCGCSKKWPNTTKPEAKKYCHHAIM